MLKDIQKVLRGAQRLFRSTCSVLGRDSKGVYGVPAAFLRDIHSMFEGILGACLVDTRSVFGCPQLCTFIVRGQPYGV